MLSQDFQKVDGRQGKFVKELVGDRVIIAQEHAVEVLMETIKEML